MAHDLHKSPENKEKVEKGRNEVERGCRRQNAWVTILSKVVSIGLPKRMPFKQGFQGGDRAILVSI